MASIRHIAVLGGGRWGRVHVSVLQALMKPNETVYWLTRSNAAENRVWLTQQAYLNVIVMEDEDTMWALQPTGMIIATATPSHATLLKNALDQYIPVLCEKPYTVDRKTAVELIEQSQSQNVVAGVNLEFLYASYLHDFAKMLNCVSIKSIDITWHDPVEEIRHGETKKTDNDTPHMHDALPHCWSVLQILLPRKLLQINNVLLNGSNVIVRATCIDNELPITFSLSRAASVRKRIVSINQGFAELNFTIEPGTSTFQGKTSTNIWRGHRPMTVAIESFLSQLASPTDNWPLSLSATLPAVELAEQGQTMLELMR